jgi:hypothetical protein
VVWDGNNKSAAVFEIILGITDMDSRVEWSLMYGSGDNRHDSRVDGVCLQESPASVTFREDNRICCLHQANSNEGKYRFSSYDGDS